MHITPRSPQELEHFVILASDPSKANNETDIKTATSALDSIRNDIPVNTAALQCIELINYTTNVHAEFFAWSTLQLCLSPKNNVSNSSVRGIIDEGCRYTIRQLVLNETNDAAQGCTAKIPRQSYIRTKMGIVIALLIQIEYPERWSTAFDDIIRILVINSSVQHTEPNASFLKIDLFLRILDGVCDEIVESQDSVVVHERNTLIKDVIRGLVPKNHTSTPNRTINNGQAISTQNTIVYKLMETLINIAQHYTNLSRESLGRYNQQNLAPFTFSVLKRFIPWIDISFIANESVLTLLYSCLTGNCTGDAEDDISTALAMKSIDCLHELVVRGMVVGKKIQLLTDINLFSNLIKINLSDNSFSSNNSRGIDLNENTDIYLAIKIAQLVNTIGLELIECWEKQTSTDNQYQDTMKKTAILLHQFIPIFFHCFTYDDIDVTGAVLPIANSIVIALGKEIKQSQNPKYEYFRFYPYLSKLMTEIYNQMQYPDDFQFDQNSEEDAEEQIFRYDLRKLYINVVRVCPKDISLQFLCQIFANIPVPLSSTPPMPLEAALRLLFHHSEGIRPNASSLMKMEPFFDLVLALHRSDISLHPLNEILTLYFDISVRYLQIFKTKPELLPSILEAISGPRGLQHEKSERVRSRSCYSLLRLVKGMSSEGRMKGYVDTAVRGIQGLLSNKQINLAHDDTLYLFETIGLLLGIPGNLTPELQTQYLAAVISPHIHSIENTLQSPNLMRDPVHFGVMLSQSIAAISYLSKGFGRGPIEDVQLILAETLQVSLRVLKLLYEQEPVRNKTMILIQRMILCLHQAKVLPLLPSFLHILIESCTSEDILNVSQLLNQICLKYGQGGAVAVDKAIYPFVQKCQSLVASLHENFQSTVHHDGTDQKGNIDTLLAVPSHVEVEKLSIQKMVYALLQHIVTNNTTIALLSVTNRIYLEKFLHLLLEGAIHIQDPGIKKACIIFFKDLIAQWGGITHEALNDETNIGSIIDPKDFLVIQNGFIHFVFKTLLPGLIQCILDPSFKDRDAMQARNLNEIALLLITAKEQRGVYEFEHQFIKQTLLSMNCPGEILAAFGNANNLKEMNQCLKSFIRVLKPK